MLSPDQHSLTLWAGFFGFVIIMLAIDLGIFNRKAHAVSMKEAAWWSVVWVVLALIFTGGLYMYMSPEKATEFITGYIIEKSLSVDNLFVFVMIFSYFKTPVQYKHRVLFWGIIGALILRGIMIWAGVALLKEFHWIFYLFGLFLLFTGGKLLFTEMDDIDPAQNPAVKFVRKFYPVSHEYDGTKFFTMDNGKRAATPMLLIILMVATTDVLFALDSIPAIFAITLDPFIVFTANVFAVLGLRALYFLLAGMVNKFHYLKYGLSAILIFVGLKMIVANHYSIPTGLSLLIIATFLFLAVSSSLIRDRRIQKQQASE